MLPQGSKSIAFYGSFKQNNWRDISNHTMDATLQLEIQYQLHPFLVSQLREKKSHSVI
jgi:hypothetical protein